MPCCLLLCMGHNSTCASASFAGLFHHLYLGRSCLMLITTLRCRTLSFLYLFGKLRVQVLEPLWCWDAGQHVQAAEVGRSLLGVLTRCAEVRD